MACPASPPSSLDDAERDEQTVLRAEHDLADARQLRDAIRLAERVVVVRHALKAAALPVVTYLGPASAGILTGSVVVESIFDLPGMGRYFVNGALNRDYTLVMGAVIVYASLLIALNLVVDLLYAALDPKVRYD